MQGPTEQIQAILSGNAFRWAVDNLPEGTSIDDLRFPDLISVTREEVFEYVVSHGFPETVVAERDAARWADDRFCIVPLDDGQWSVFYTERGTRSQQVTVESYAAAQRRVVEILFDYARTALNHRWWHAHPTDRPRHIADMP